MNDGSDIRPGYASLPCFAHELACGPDGYAMFDRTRAEDVARCGFFDRTLERLQDDEENPRVLLEADGAGSHTVGSSTGKAFTSASLGRDTAALASAIAANPELEGLRDMDPRLVILAGGVPIRIGGQLLGGIGVGGAPSGAIDEGCARAGLTAVGAGEEKE